MQETFKTSRLPERLGMARTILTPEVMELLRLPILSGSPSATNMRISNRRERLSPTPVCEYLTAETGCLRELETREGRDFFGECAASHR